MKLYSTLLLCLISAIVHAQLLSWSPDFIQDANAGNVTITVDATRGNHGLYNHTPTSDVYVHTGVITSLSTSSSDWKYSKFTWGTPNPLANATYLGNNKWSFTITGGLRAFYGVPVGEKILKIAILFRDGAGTTYNTQRNADATDMYIPVYDGTLAVRLTDPITQPKYTPIPEVITKNVGDALPITAKASAAATLKLFLNGVQVGSTVASGTSIVATPNITVAGTQEIVAEAVNGITKRDTIKFYVAGTTNVAAQPANTRDGINYIDGSTVTLVLYAPDKTRVSVIGDMNNWTETTQYQMNRTPDASRYWITLTGLTPGTEYGFQYLIDGDHAFADIHTEKVLDPYNDKYILPETYPNLKPYPVDKTSGVVGILQTNKPVYNWQVPNFSRPNKNNLVIYELLIRDFVATQRWKTVKDSLPYLKKLGISAIELMPVNEFEGNNSWGYNPDFFFAPDKNYGTETDFKDFIDACHINGIAVIMDIAMNHAYGLSPTVQMYIDTATNKPAANNPWHNVDAKHPYNVGYDFNHEAQPTKDLVDRVIEQWLVNYKIDGFRWDLAKGFTQTYSGGDVNLWSQYDQSRINIWKRIYDKMQSLSAGSYCILEHFAVADEENVLAGYGMMLWRNRNNAYIQSAMGYTDNSDFGWSGPNFVTYQESHDEERLMYKNYQYGNATSGPPPYSAKSTVTALRRMAMTASFWAMQPFPKMMWQFEELGYDTTISACNDGRAPNLDNCKTSPKPIKWDYLNNANRKALYDVYAKLLTLRKVPEYLPAFTSTSIGGSLGDNFKWFQVTTNALKICVIGNFDVVSHTGAVTFQNAGTWYTYVAGGSQFPTTRVATGGSENITLAAGEYYVFLDRDPSSALPATYTFNGNGLWNNSANWLNGKMPPATLNAGSEIIIAPIPDGECVLNVQQNVATGGKITVQSGKNFRIQSELHIQ